MPNLPSYQPKFERNHTSTVAAKMMVPAFMMKDFTRSQMWMQPRLRRAGRWYWRAAPSRTGLASPANQRVFLSMMPETMMAATPMK